MTSISDLLRTGLELSEKAAPRPWSYSRCYGVATIEPVGSREPIACAVEYLKTSDADYIVHACNYFPSLAAEIERLEHEAAYYKGWPEHMEELESVNLEQAALVDKLTRENEALTDELKSWKLGFEQDDRLAQLFAVRDAAENLEAVYLEHARLSQATCTDNLEWGCLWDADRRAKADLSAAIAASKVGV